MLLLSREELMRHEAAGITTQAFPKTLRMGGVDCLTTYLHEPGDARDGVTVDVPLFALNQVNEERCEWLVPGMLKDKIQALLKSLPQRPRSRFVPLPESAARLAAELSVPELFGNGSLTDVLLKKARDETSPFVHFAHERLRGVINDFFAADPGLATEMKIVHQFRIRAKELRYSLELMYWKLSLLVSVLAVISVVCNVVAGTENRGHSFLAGQ